MEAIPISFHMRYGSMICSKRLQSDRPKSWGMLVEAGATQSKTVSKTTVLEWCENRGCLSLSFCHLAVSQSWASYHTSADIIFLNFFQANRYYLSMFLSCSRVCHISSTIWYVTLLPLGADHAIIPHMEAKAIPFHMRYGSMICSKRLQSDRPHKRLSLLALVHPRMGLDRETREGHCLC